MSTRESTSEHVLRGFAPRSLWDARLIVLAADDALALIERARQERCPVLGVDGFFVNRGMIQPSIEHSIDYTSERAPVVGAWLEAAEFVRHHSKHVSGFEVCLGEPENTTS